MARINRGEIWLVDLGYAAKIRPCVVVSVPTEGQERVLATLVPHTTSVRGTRFEVNVPKAFLKAGAFDAQGLVTVPSVHLIRRLGELTSAEMGLVGEVLREWLGLRD